MFKHILVPTDFGEPAQAAFDTAVALAQKFASRLTVVHVYPIVPGMPYGSAFVWPAERIAAAAREALAQYMIAAQARHSGCESMLRPGFPGEEIVAAAAESGADLIVMGTHGRRGLPRMLLGSTAERVVRTAAVPVLTVAAQDEALTLREAGGATRTR
jgi:nucleotide-binding universal stress UspA family protein